MNVLVEAKNEYTIRIINILSPLILEGLNSIYQKAKDISTSENVLKIFQSFLKRIPKWNSEILDAEVNRIKTNCKNFDLLCDLIRAAIKANLSVLVFNPFNQTSKPKIDSNYYKDLDFSNFVHNIYLESAREVWNNPYLFYHNYTAIEIKRNQRDTIDLIKKCIEESIRKTLPLKHVLEIYLGDDMIQPTPCDDFENTITEVDEKNLSNLLKKELNDDKFIMDKKEVEQKLEIATDKPNTIESFQIPNKSPIEERNTQNSIVNTANTNNTDSSFRKSRKTSSSEKSLRSLSQKGGNKSSTDKPLNSKILSILNDDNLNLSDDNSTSEKRIEKKKLSETSTDDLISSNMDSNLKNILKKDLGNTESDSSMQFRPEQNSSKYQEIFSNSNNETNSINSQEKNEEINKNKFFNNYLAF